MKAMILAAGRGERMRPLTDALPKPLLCAGGKPLIVHHLQRLAAAGVSEVVINHAYRGEQIEQALGNGNHLGVNIVYSPESRALETGGGIKAALPLLGEQPFLVINADIWTDYPLQRLLSLRPDAAHLVLVDNPPHNPAGDFVLDEHGLLRSEGQRRLTFAGISVLAPALLRDWPAEAFALKEPLLRAIAAAAVAGEHYCGQWMDIGTPERLQNLQSLLQSAH